MNVLSESTEKVRQNRGTFFLFSVYGKTGGTFFLFSVYGKQRERPISLKKSVRVFRVCINILATSLRMDNINCSSLVSRGTALPAGHNDVPCGTIKDANSHPLLSNLNSDQREHQ
jgi:hypothetical protein